MSLSAHSFCTVFDGLTIDSVIVLSKEIRHGLPALYTRTDEALLSYWAALLWSRNLLTKSVVQLARANLLEFAE